MNTSDDRDQSAQVDPVLDEIRPDPNLELAHQHDEDRDPLDEAIIDEHENLEKSEAGIMVKDRNLNPPPADEYD